MTPKRVGLIIAGLLVFLVVCGIIALATPSKSAPTRIVTIDASDGKGGIIDPINVSATYVPRGVTVARLHQGDKVTLISRDGDGVLIQTADGTRGWVTYWFIKELQ